MAFFLLSTTRCCGGSLDIVEVRAYLRAHKRQGMEAREEHEGFEARYASWKPAARPFGVPPDQGLSGNGQGEVRGASNALHQVVSASISVKS